MALYKIGSNIIRLSGGGGMFSNGDGGGANTPEPSYFDLALISPRASGTAGIGTGTGLSTADRIFFAYTSLEYVIPVAFIGGSPPFTVTLSNAPSGMVAEEYTAASGQTLWRIRWPDPTSTASNIVCRVTDSQSTFVEGTWSITVGTSGWNFVDASNSAGGRDGSIANPWNSLTELRTNAAAGSRTYFKNGTYTPSATQGAGYFSSMNFNSGSHSVVWIAYPSHAPVIDQGWPGSGNTATPCIEFNHSSGSNPPWVDGFTMQNFCEKGFMFGHYNAHGWTVTNCTFQDSGAAEDGFNSGCINQRDFNPDVRYGCKIVNCTFRRIGFYGAPSGSNGNIGLKGYSMSHTLIEGNLISDTGAQTEGFFAMKSDMPMYFVRLNKAWSNFNMPLVGGNQNTYNSETNVVSGEVSYNLVKSGAAVSGVSAVGIHMAYFGHREDVSAVTQANPCAVTTSVDHHLNTGDTVWFRTLAGMTQLNTGFFVITVTGTTTFTLNGVDSTAYSAFSYSANNQALREKWAYRGAIKLYRNTVSGNILLDEFNEQDDGVLSRHNVLVNDQGANTPWEYHYDLNFDEANDSTRLTIEANLAAASGLIDADGLLTGTDRTTYLGTRGHEIP